MEESWLSARSRCSNFSNEERRERGSWSIEFPANHGRRQNLEVDGEVMEIIVVMAGMEVLIKLVKV